MDGLPCNLSVYFTQSAKTLGTPFTEPPASSKRFVSRSFGAGSTNKNFHYMAASLMELWRGRITVLREGNNLISKVIILPTESRIGLSLFSSVFSTTVGADVDAMGGKWWPFVASGVVMLRPSSTTKQSPMELEEERVTVLYKELHLMWQSSLPLLLLSLLSRRRHSLTTAAASVA